MTVTATTYESASSAVVTLAKPGAAAVGDLLIATITHSSPLPITAGIPEPAGYLGGYLAGYDKADPVAEGWVVVGHAESTVHAIAVMTKVVETGETSYTFPVVLGRCSGALVHVPAALGLDGATVTAFTPSSATSLILPNISYSYDGDVIFEAYAVATPGLAVTVPAGLTPLTATTGTGLRLVTATAEPAGVGSTGPSTWTFTPNAAPYAQVAVGFAVRPTTLIVSQPTTWSNLERITSSRQSTWAAASSALISARSTTWTTKKAVAASRATTWADLLGLAVFQSTTWTTFGSSTTATFLPSVRLRLYAPIGGSLGLLPAPQAISAAYPLDDLGSLTFSYLVRGPSASLLGQPCEVALELSPDNGQTWFEPPDSRFRYSSDQRDPLDPADKYDVACTAYVQRLEKAQVYPNGLINSDGDREFLSKTPGAILDVLFREAQARGALSGITWTFTPGVDSSGAAWAKVMTIYYTPGLPYLQILQNMADQGFIDFRMIGRTLQIYNADTVLAQDRTVGAGQTLLISGRDLTEAPFRRTWEDLADSAYFQGDKGTSYQFTNPAAETPWGRQEVFIANGSVTDSGTMAAITQETLALGDHERTEYTRGLDFTRSPLTPLHDYFVGDYVWSTVDGNAPERLRVRQITLTVDDKNVVSGNVVLNDRFLEADVRAKRRVEGITNGASGNAPLPDKPPTDTKDTVAPAKVGGLIGTSAAYLSVGSPTGPAVPTAGVGLDDGVIT